MAEQEKRKAGGGKLSRSETVTVRLDPKLRYLAELAARKQRRTLSSFVEWAVQDCLERERLSESWGDNPGVSIADEASQLWDVDDADRFAKLALHHPEMLTHEEQIRWKLVRENGYLWRGKYEGTTREWTWRVDESRLIFARLREHWDVFCAVAKGEADKEKLPTWLKKDPESTDNSDIPF